MTIRQGALRVPHLWRQLRPTFHLPSVAAIDSGFIDRHAVNGVIWDIDGTVMGCRHRAVAADLHAAVSTLLVHPGLRHVVLSNCDEFRFLELSQVFPTVSILRGYTSSAGTTFRQRIGVYDLWEGTPPGAHSWRPLRKPSRLLVEYALRVLGVSRSQVLLVGDQYLTDIAGANLAGVRSVKVPTVAPQSFPLSVRLLQRLDLTLYQLAMVRGTRTATRPR